MTPLSQHLRRGTSLIAIGAALIFAANVASAGAERLAPGSLRLLPHTPGTGSTFAVNATFDQQPGTQLQAYDVDIARGLRIDPRAVAGRCSVARARAGKCPRSSRIGSGEGAVRVQGPAVPRGGAFTLS